MKKSHFLFFFFFSLVSFAQITPSFIQLKPHYKYNVSFNYTGAVQTWTVPAGVNQIFIDVAGAQGGNYNLVQGGKGGKISCRMAVIPGTLFYITVGGQSSTNSAVFGNGGNGGTGANTSRNGMAGGGLSAFATANPLTQANALIIAGGGGGATGRIGGFGGGTSGANGFATNPSRGGKGGTQVAGGVAGTVFDNNTVLPTAGSTLTGGRGGSVTSSTWTAGGGGGAGFFGGGGGVGGGNEIGGGGGGSSWSHVSCLQLSNISNFNKGNGRIFIYYN
jgi:hypothetical protein